MRRFTVCAVSAGPAAFPYPATDFAASAPAGRPFLNVRMFYFNHIRCSTRSFADLRGNRDERIYGCARTDNQVPKDASASERPFFHDEISRSKVTGLLNVIGNELVPRAMPNRRLMQPTVPTGCLNPRYISMIDKKLAQ
jgi:hypothetical protein